MTFEDILAVYNGSDGEATKALYARLIATDMVRGQIAVNLLRTCKASERAKKYRGKPGRGGPSYRAMAYEKKDWSINELCRALVQSEVIESWGWGFDAKAIGFEHVLYCNIPGFGQVSFHTSYRKDGHDYAGVWDQVRNEAPNRICRFAEAVLNGRDLTNEGGND